VRVPAARGDEPVGAPAPSFEEAVASARRAGKALVLEVGAAWCEPCQLMAAELARPQGRAALGPLQLVRYDVDVAPGAEVEERFQVSSYPTLVAVDADGNEIARLVGFEDLRALRAWLGRVRAQAARTATAARASGAVAPPRRRRHAENLIGHFPRSS
jgi:thioredoxin-like negative regulator of GroEL